MAYFFAAILTVGFISCGDDDKEKDDPGNPDTPVNPVNPSKDEAMSAADQKEYIEMVALDFMDMMPASDFRELTDLAKYIDKTYIEDYNWGAVHNWAEEIFKTSRESLGIETTETDSYSSTYKYNRIYTNYKAILLASNFTGHFTAINGRWLLSKADDLQFIFTDSRGQECVLKLETSGNVKKVCMFNIDDWTGWDYDNKNNVYITNDYYDRTQCTIGVPEKIVLSLTRAGGQMVKTTIKFDLANITNEEFDISKSSLTFSALVELNNGYKIDIQKVAYTGNTNATFATIISKNGTTLISMGASANISGLPAINLSAFSSDFNKHDFDTSNAKDLYVKLDILEKIQIQGKLSDVRKFAEYLKEAANNKYEEKTYKSYINQANSLVDVNLFYDGKSVKQASFKLEPFSESDRWSSRMYWTVEPVMIFSDGTSYSTFEAFFNKKDFKVTIDTFKSLVENYIDLVE